MSTSSARCSSGRAASWLPIAVHVQGITRTRHYSHTPRASRCDLLKLGSQILTTPDGSRGPFNTLQTRWMGPEAGRRWASSASRPALFGHRRTRGNRACGCVEGYGDNCGVGRLWILPKSHRTQHRVQRERDQNKSHSPRGLLHVSRAPSPR